MGKILWTLIPIFSMSCGTARLSKSEAIELAEKYVLEQGYTDKEIVIDSTQLDLDLFENRANKNGVLKLRHNTLEPAASFSSKGLRRWTVGFRNVRDTTRFRVVVIPRNGKKIRMEHQDLKSY